MRPVARAGRWAWGLCGLATAAALAVPGARLILSAGYLPAKALPASSPRVQAPTRVHRTVTVPQPVTSLNVQSYGGPIRVTAVPVSHVQITEVIAYYGRQPTVVQSVSDGRLSLADPACADDSCSVSLAVKVPQGVTVTAVGGPLVISGTSGANLDSAGAQVSATNIHGPLTVRTHGGPLQVNGLTGPLHAYTDGGPVTATRITSATAVVTTGSGLAQLTFSAPPESVTISTGGGPATLTVPGGPYALNANSRGAAKTIGIALSTTARRSITVNTDGGPLVIASPKDGKPPAPASAQAGLSSEAFTPYAALGLSSDDALAPGESWYSLVGPCMNAAGYPGVTASDGIVTIGIPDGHFGSLASLAYTYPWGGFGYLGIGDAQEYGFNIPINAQINAQLTALGLGALPANWLSVPAAEQAAASKCFTIINDFRMSTGNGPSMAVIGTLGNDVYTHMARNRAVHGAGLAWSACMAQNGYRFGPPQDVFAKEEQAMYGANPGLSATVSPAANQAQIAAAVTDADCTQSSDLAGIYFAAEASYEQQLVSANRQALAAAVSYYRTAYAKELKRLPALLRTTP